MKGLTQINDVHPIKLIYSIVMVQYFSAFLIISSKRVFVKKEGTSLIGSFAVMDGGTIYVFWVFFSSIQCIMAYNNVLFAQ